MQMLDHVVIMLGDSNIERVSEAVFLGIVLDEQLYERY